MRGRERSGGREGETERTDKRKSVRRGREQDEKKGSDRERRVRLGEERRYRG